jgi:hypothetical protein
VYKEELHNLYASSSIIRTAESKSMGWAGHAARREEECMYGFGGKARRKETISKTKK